MTTLRLAVPAAILALLAAAPTASAAGQPTNPTWHGKQVKAYDAQAAGRFGKGVVVAVLDGWVDRTHPDFEGRVLAGADCTGGTCRPGETQDACEHGTHVAGTVASSSFGIAPKATVLPIRVLAYDGKGECTGEPDAVAAGIRWAGSHGADVLNLSLGPDVPGLGTTSAIPTAVHEAAQAGIVVIFSAGNADLPVAQAYGDDALIVAATGPDGRLASYSQHGQGVSVAAPGGQPDSADRCTQATCVTSLYPRGLYAVAAGTSMAAPHVSGIAALLLGQQPGRARQSVMDRLTGTAHPLAGAGSGLVDAKAALGVTTSAAGPVASPPARVKARTHIPTRTTTSLAAPKAPAARPRTTPPAAAPSSTPSAAPKRAAVPDRVGAVPRAVTLRDTPPTDHIPVPLAAFAGILIGLAGTAVLRLPDAARR